MVEEGISATYFLAALRILASLLGSALANPDSFEVFPNRTELQT